MSSSQSQITYQSCKHSSRPYTKNSTTLLIQALGFVATYCLVPSVRTICLCCCKCPNPLTHTCPEEAQKDLLVLCTVQRQCDLQPNKSYIRSTLPASSTVNVKCVYGCKRDCSSSPGVQAMLRSACGHALN